MKDYKRNMLLLLGSMAIIIGAQRLGLGGDVGAVAAFLFVLVVLAVEAMAQRRRTRATLRRLETVCRLHPDELRQRLEDK